MSARRSIIPRRRARLAPRLGRRIERWHQTLKNRILLENDYLSGNLEAQIEALGDHYNHHRDHESVGNLTPADAYFGPAQAILSKRKIIAGRTFERRQL